MASIVLSAAGSALGSATGVPFLGQAGGIFGGVAAGFIGSTTKLPDRYGARLVDLAIQTSTYGKMIPIVYGTMRLGGNIIWSRPIKETATTTTTTSSGGGGKGGGGRVSQSTTSYSYSVTLAIAICEGPVDSVLRIWADAGQLDLSKYTVRIYKGDDTQMPDSLIQALEGGDKTPAYRGMAYIVIEDFPLEQYGNRIPNFTFEVKKYLQAPDYNNESLENMISAMTMIPASGEFVYDTIPQYKLPGLLSGSTFVQQGNQISLNMHNVTGAANALLSLDQLKDDCPNVEWVSLVVGWFGTSMTLSNCSILPGVEYKIGGITSPNGWQAGGYSRSSAHLISQIGGAPQFGGTPDDGSIVRYATELRSRGYKVMFYPLLFMDVTGKPWRGLLTGDAADMHDFFTKSGGYNAYITHYANLLNGKIDAFSIGSELVGLTTASDTPGVYPAVSELVSLAATVKSILGSGVKVTYAADWSEYHSRDGWYHLDPLWSSSAIDVVGIDAYFPLKDSPLNSYDIDEIMAGWSSGEGYDYYYSDPERTVQVPLAPEYAWKNIDWWWSNNHVNPNSLTTSWVPGSKKIWFTEYGFASVDNAVNQPNVFFDATTSGSALPYHSKGRVDFRAQRVGHVATQQYWKNSDMVERMFAWTWDARPYPYWPDLLNVWNDGAVWKTGHWLQGKLRVSSLGAILKDLCLRSGLTADDINVAHISDQVEGFIIAQQQTLRQAIETLQQAYFFDVIESDYRLKFLSRGQDTILEIDEKSLVLSENEQEDPNLQIIRIQEIELPKRTSVVFVNRLLNYQSAVQHSQRQVTSSLESVTITLPIVLTDQNAKKIADVALFTKWVERTSFEFDLPIRYAALEPGDVITLTINGNLHTMRITGTQLHGSTIIHVNAVAEDRNAYDFYTAPGEVPSLIKESTALATTKLSLFDIPALPGDTIEQLPLRIAAVELGDSWGGAAIYRSEDGGANYGRLTDITIQAAQGTALSVLGDGPAHIMDWNASIEVLLQGDSELQSVTQIALLNGANVALVGNEIIQFKNATLTGQGQYRLKGLLRGRLGTEWAITGHITDELFVLLDGRVQKLSQSLSLLGLNRSYKAVTFGDTLANSTPQDFILSGIALKPYAPVHVRGVRDAANNLAIRWTRRSRLAPIWLDGVDVPLNEERELYDLEILNGSSVVRTIGQISENQIIYSLAEQINDFGSSPSSVTIRIYQRSAVVGRGYPAIASI